MLGLGAGAGVGVDLEAEAYDLEVDATALMDRMDGADLRIALSETDMMRRGCIGQTLYVNQIRGQDFVSIDILIPLTFAPVT